MTDIKAPEGGRPVSEMLERIARALCKRNCIHPWDEQPKAVRESFLADALAAMKTIREPTPVMIPPGRGSEAERTRYRAMIDREITIAEGGKDGD